MSGLVPCAFDGFMACERSKKGIRIALIAFGICALLGIVDLVLDIVDKAWVDSMSSFAFDISKLVLWGALFFIYLGKYRGNKS